MKCQIRIQITSELLDPPFPCGAEGKIPILLQLHHAYLQYRLRLYARTDHANRFSNPGETYAPQVIASEPVNASKYMLYARPGP